MNVISIVTPSRGRCQKAVGYIRSIEETATHPERVEVSLRVDDDDPDAERYQEIPVQGWGLKKVHVEVGPSLLGDIGQMWNVLVPHTTGNILYAGNDDLMHVTPGWDVVLDRYVAQYPDEIYCLWFDDRINGAKHCAFPIVSRKWYDILGFLYPRGLKYCYPDTWVFDIGQRVGRAVYIPEVVVEHHWMGRRQDETYRRSRRQGEGDAQAFIAREPERIAQAELIRKVMQ